ncbi:TauD/TfdA family dioxygenase [Bradyrhizobium sp. 146]|uniref:TauD/TfdA family dioxygenase n=1 Tax=Bradyrhizobium sp. 146 TaxID=2782622 RepID=UPI001FFA4480|nr:TauD/TfdA family dioxygenase [Bradyrhizobium sp. 146]MCK1705336.1 TauD/TfdA family dioxygenase [Bradyrhizobium sp. 146]
MTVLSSQKRSEIGPDLTPRVIGRGWLSMSLPRLSESFEEDLLALSRWLGEPVSGRKRAAVESLRLLSREAAHPRSLSAIHGQQAFPMHTDGAHHVCPPRFLVIACRSPGKADVPTLLTRFSNLALTEDEARQCEAGTFLVRNGRRSFYASITDRAREFIRFDQGCMTPVTREAAAALEAMRARLSGCEKVEVHWREGDVLIIDNWRVLHGRGQLAPFASPDRHLQRVSIQ